MAASPPPTTIRWALKALAITSLAAHAAAQAACDMNHLLESLPAIQQARS
jgi:hypothetical protein